MSIESPWDVCTCGDYRLQHKDNGRCGLRWMQPDCGCTGFVLEAAFATQAEAEAAAGPRESPNATQRYPEAGDTAVYSRPPMDREEAIRVLRGMESVKRTLGAAPRRGKLARSVGEKLRQEADALAVALKEMGA